uniref:Cell division protein FtsL n=1 Tax=candidate division CPR3 bacterium TaxID=2268181 RepID=A0A7C4QXP4_UNCC3
MKLRFKRKKRVGSISRYNATYAKKGLKMGPVSLGFVTVLIFSLISLFYLAQSNQIATKGYTLQELEKSQSKILSENERLQVEAARLESLNKAASKAKDLSMVPVKELKYFNNTSSLAQK